MKGTRKEFIAAAVVATGVVGVPALATSLSGSASASTLTSTPSPSPSPSPAPSPAAQALAEQMRGFDATLSDEQVHSIAQGIQQNFDFGKVLNAHGTHLKNSDPPTPEFHVNP